MSKKKRRRRRGIPFELVFLVLEVVLILALLVAIAGTFRSSSDQHAIQLITADGDDGVTFSYTDSGTEGTGDQGTAETGGSSSDTEELASAAKETSSDDVMTTDTLFEEDIYSFFQGPKAWKKKLAWSGKWCKAELAGSKFSVFGCGLVCMANIYCTLSPYECSPLDMYTYAQEVSNYRPGGGVGAIDWKDIRKTLKKAGFTCELRKKDKSYKEFRKAIRNAKTAIVLVSSTYDDSIWKNTYGHYVTLWLYHSDDQTVFLADPGDIANNRSRVSLKSVYRALKKISSYQYLLVTSYNEEKNQWKHDGISEKWRKPEYYREK